MYINVSWSLVIRIRIRIDLKCWIRIHIDINMDPKHRFFFFSFFLTSDSSFWIGTSNVSSRPLFFPVNKKKLAGKVLSDWKCLIKNESILRWKKNFNCSHGWHILVCNNACTVPWKTPSWNCDNFSILYPKNGEDRNGLQLNGLNPPSLWSISWEWWVAKIAFMISFFQFEPMHWLRFPSGSFSLKWYELWNLQ